MDRDYTVRVLRGVGSANIHCNDCDDVSVGTCVRADPTHSTYRLGHSANSAFLVGNERSVTVLFLTQSHEPMLLG
jgi:hypothetical protein